MSLYLPDLKQLRHLAERYKNLGHHVVVEAARSGKLRLSVETDAVEVVTHFKDLESPRCDDTALSGVPGLAGDSRVQQRINESVMRSAGGGGAQGNQERYFSTLLTTLEKRSENNRSRFVSPAVINGRIPSFSICFSPLAVPRMLSSIFSAFLPS